MFNFIYSKYYLRIKSEIRTAIKHENKLFHDGQYHGKKRFFRIFADRWRPRAG